MKIVDAITASVDSSLLIVMAVSFAAVVWWGFRGRGRGDGGDSGGNDAGGNFWDGSDGDGDGGGD